MSDYVPTELLDEILVRVPVESLIRFTSVCKTWYSLITSPTFIAKHLNHSKTNKENLLLAAYTFNDIKERYLLCCGEEKFIDEFTELESPLSTSLGHKTIVGSCNGLVCMFDGYLPMPPIIIWNPLIRKSVAFPMPSLPQTSHSCNGLVCMFDGYLPMPPIIIWNPLIRKSVAFPMPSLPQTSHWTFALGFGAHPLTHEYMVVYIVYEKEDIEQRKFPSKVELYTQGTESWRSITAVGHPHHIASFNCLQAFVNGAIHWIAFSSRVVDGLLHTLIMLFNIGSLEFSVMMMPAALVGQSLRRLSIMPYGETLAVLCRGQEGSCGIWVMKEYGVAESWAKLYHIDLPGGLDRVIGLRKNGKVMLSASDKRLLWYDCESKTLTNTGLFGSSGYTFMGSLVLLKPGNGVF